MEVLEKGARAIEQYLVDGDSGTATYHLGRAKEIIHERSHMRYMEDTIDYIIRLTNAPYSPTNVIRLQEAAQGFRDTAQTLYHDYNEAVEQHAKRLRTGEPATV